MTQESKLMKNRKLIIGLLVAGVFGACATDVYAYYKGTCAQDPNDGMCVSLGAQCTVTVPSSVSTGYFGGTSVVPGWSSSGNCTTARNLAGFVCYCKF